MNPNNANNNQIPVLNPQGNGNSAWPVNTANNNFPSGNQSQQMQPVPNLQQQPVQDIQNNPFLKNLNLEKYDKHLNEIKAKADHFDSIQAANNNKQIFAQQSVAPQNLQSFQQQPQQMAAQQFSQQQTQQQQAVVPQFPQQQPQAMPNYQQNTNLPLNPGILAQSLVHSENKQAIENQMGSAAVSPEVSANLGNDAQTERAVENIVEQLKNVENSPEDSGEKNKANSDDTKGDPADVKEDVKDLTKAASSAIGKVKVYGYQLPQKLLNLASAGKLTPGISADVSSTKTWLVALVGRIIQIKSLSD